MGGPAINGKGGPSGKPATTGSVVAKSVSAEEALKDTLMAVVRVLMVMAGLYSSYKIRLYAVEVYGRVIHEFDPWFNYRATEVLGQKVTSAGWYQGLTDFFHWCEQLCDAGDERRRSLPVLDGAAAGMTTCPGTRSVGRLAPRSTQGCRSRLCLSGKCSAWPQRTGESRGT